MESSSKLAVLYAPDASTAFVFDERDAHTKLGFALTVPEGIEIPEEGVAEASPEGVSDLGAETIVVLRPTSEETPERLPLGSILDALGGAEGGPLVLRQIIDPTRLSSSPVADKQAIASGRALVGGSGEVRESLPLSGRIGDRYEPVDAKDRED